MADGRLMCADHAAERAGVPVGGLPVLAMDADERRYAEDCIEDNRRHRVLRGAEQWAEAREEEGRSISDAFEGWTEKNWHGDDFAAAYVAWLHTTGHAADPVHAWAVTGPVDRVQQAEVRLEAARGQLAYAEAAHCSAQRYQGEAGRRQAWERLHTANVAVAAAAADHAAEVTVRAEQEEGLDVPAAAVAVRYRFGQPTGELGGRVVLVDGYVAGRVRESGRHWYAIESGWDALPTEHADRDAAAALLPPRPPSPGGPCWPSPGSANSPGPPYGAARWHGSCGCGSGGRRATPLRPGPSCRPAGRRNSPTAPSSWPTGANALPPRPPCWPRPRPAGRTPNREVIEVPSTRARHRRTGHRGRECRRPGAGPGRPGGPSFPRGLKTKKLYKLMGRVGVRA